jgi:hypothetical protein
VGTRHVKGSEVILVFHTSHVLVLCQPPNKQLERTVIRRHMRAASAPFHYALAARFIRRRAAAELRR